MFSFTLILFTLSVGIVIGTLVNQGVKAAKSDNPAAPGATPLVIPNPVELSNSFSQIAKQVEPSVVNISTDVSAQSAGPLARQRTPPGHAAARRGSAGRRLAWTTFFTASSATLRRRGRPRDAAAQGSALGSGVVVDKAGYILTNNHVVDKADRIQVKFNDDPVEYDAKVVGVDPPPTSR